MAKRDDVSSGRLVYTCRCGWLDREHINAGTAKFLWASVKNEKNDFSILKTGLEGGGRRWRSRGESDYYHVQGEMHQQIPQNIMSYLRMIPIIGKKLPWTILNGRVIANATVKKGLSLDQKKGVALSIYKKICYNFEDYQNTVMRKYIIPPVGVNIALHEALYLFANYSQHLTSFSGEDLVSDLISFYAAVNGFKEKDIMNICGAVSKKTSLKIWDENGGIGKNRTFKPILYKCGACAGKGTSFPSEFKTIIEAKEGTLYKMHSIVRQPPEYDSIYDVAALARVATLARLPNFFHL